MTFAIGYDNNIESISSYAFTTGSEDGSNPFANCYDNKLYDHMALAASASAYQIDLTFGSAVSANYVAFYKTNLSDIGGTIQIYYNDSGYTDASGLITPSSSAPVLSEFPAQSSTQWRIEIDNNNTDATIGDIKIGTLLETEIGVYQGDASIIMARDVDYNISVAEGGLSLGRSISSRGVSWSYNIEHMTDSWVRSTWQPFVIHAEQYPFYVAWDNDDYGSEVAYCESEGALPKPVHTSPGRQSVQLPVRGFIV